MFTEDQSRQERLIISMSAIAAAMVAAVLLGGTLIQRTLMVDLVAERGLAHAAAIEAQFGEFDGVLAGRATAEETRMIGAVMAAAGAVDFALVDAGGRTVLAAFADDLGAVDSSPAFADLAFGFETLTWLEDRRGALVGPEMLGTVYVPYVRYGEFVGALRLDIDISGEARAIEGRVTDAQTAIIAFWIVLSGLAAMALAGRHPATVRTRPARGFGA